MDKYEYKVRSEEITNLIEEEKYADAVKIADTIDWRRVKSSTMLLKIAALYRVNKRNEDGRSILLLAYDRYPTNRSVVYSLCEVSIELDDVVAAIEYYKQFVKLAPEDSGVYTLRYRILEMQEANLEERIEILEELKVKDYQEEWVYELAYLYHRVGLATKCVEVCDELILWIGDGPYVMKAMELKALHVPLTEAQQAKYDFMLRNANGNYSAAGYDSDGYDDENYDNQGYDNEAYDNETYNNETYDNETYGNDGYDNGGYADGQGEEYYGEEGYNEEGYNEQGYNEEGYIAEQGEEYYGEEGYDSQNFDNENYNNENYDNEGYAENGEYYSDENYSEEGYSDENYEENGYDENYNGEQFDNNEGYSEEFYVEENYSETEQPSQPDVDMSQYNTINLQKLVAESMKEIFPDDDSFEEEREKFDDEESDDDVSSVAQMVSSVKEETPQPDTGAVSKVLVPGEDADFIQPDTDMEELRSTTEQSVNDEHAQMERNLENVYRDHDMLSDDAQAGNRPVTGQINIDEAIGEWERIKLDNAKKHQEEIKKQVLSQTGKIFDEFNDSINNGVLEELENENQKPKETEIPTAPKNEDDEYITDLEKNVVDEIGGLTKAIPSDEINKVVHDEPVADNTTYAAEPEYYEDENLEAQVENAEAENIEAEEYYGDENAEPEEYYGDEADIENVEAEEYYGDEAEAENVGDEEYYEEIGDDEPVEETPVKKEKFVKRKLEPEEEEEIVEMAKEDALKTQEIKMNTADLSSLSEKIVEATHKEASGAKREEVRDFTPQEQTLFENFAVTKKIKKQIINALDNMSLAAYTGNVIVTGDAGLDTMRMAKHLIKEYQSQDAEFSGKIAKITGEKINERNIKEIFDKLDKGGIIIEKANGMSEEKLYEMASLLNQENLGIVVILEDTRKEITKLLEKQAMIADYFNLRIDLMEMDNNALVAYAKNYALALEYAIDELGTLALYTRISNMQSGNHVVTKDEVREIIDEAIYKSKKSKIKNFVDVLFARRYDDEDMIVLKERDFI